MVILMGFSESAKAKGFFYWHISRPKVPGVPGWAVETLHDPARLWVKFFAPLLHPSVVTAKVGLLKTTELNQTHAFPLRAKLKATLETSAVGATEEKSLILSP